MVRCRSWVFVLNNPTEEEIAKIQEIECKYLIFGKEHFEVDLNDDNDWTPHLQGYVTFLNPVTLAQAKGRLSDRVHLEKPQGSALQNKEYCSKGNQPKEEWTKLRTAGPNYGLDADVFEKGEVPTQGKRSDLKRLIDDIQNGTRSAKKLRLEHPEVCAKYPGFVSQILQDTRPKPEKPAIQLREWQVELLNILKMNPEDRKIYWYCEAHGNRGKTTFATWLEAELDDVQIFTPGKHADMSYYLDEETKILIMDCPRSKEESFPYSFLEGVKDGRVFSPKYASGMKHVQKCHVLVLANFLPDMTKLSHDRLVIKEIMTPPCEEDDTQLPEVIEI